MLQQQTGGRGGNLYHLECRGIIFLFLFFPLVWGVQVFSRILKSNGEIDREKLRMLLLHYKLLRDLQ